MPNGQIIKYNPVGKSCVVGLKVPDATPNFIYTPGKGLCPVKTSQQKNAKQTLPVGACFVTELKK
jgi:hypothetical protein